jgi:hypothetical protein
VSDAGGLTATGDIGGRIGDYGSAGNRTGQGIVCGSWKYYVEIELGA